MVHRNEIVKTNVKHNIHMLSDKYLFELDTGITVVLVILCINWQLITHSYTKMKL